ncbi:YMGG-like glycine zipper-containing protein [Sediminicoccus sp. KRV36]|uniref:YMGG-like glycine zipper-containing protein n=1 Tax=Sediminicoccus sp. KRV36 TaxID=3133721 RepID=UPI00200ECB1E|nr:YMGG-like glycine zipper-containing protein [Sediminicoccus rosea]UPY37744.1 YMGG-like glycine zipper-containing protein [Sediminicoccus rosea]
MARLVERSSLHRATAALAAALMLAGCVTTQAGRIGPDDGRDACRPQLLALDSTGDFYGEQILQGAAIGAVSGALIGGLASGRWQGALIGAAVGGAGGAAVGYYAALQRQASDQRALYQQMSTDLSRENAQLDRTQIAFNNLMDCRLRTAERVRDLVRSGRMDRATAQAQMTEIRGRFQADLALAQSINGRIGARGTEFDTAIDSAIPGGKAAIQTAAYRPAPVRVAPRRNIEVKFSPSPDSARIGTVNAREVVAVRPGPAGSVVVETASGVRGYAPADAFPPQRAAPDPSQQAAATGDVRSLAATNISRRENFAESVSNAERLAQAGGGFELTS